MIYDPIAPLTPLITRFAPRYATTTDRLGRAMPTAARRGFPTRIVENAELRQRLLSRPIALAAHDTFPAVARRWKEPQGWFRNTLAVRSYFDYAARSGPVLSVTLLSRRGLDQP